MPVNQSLLALVMARSIVERVSTRHGVQAADLRTLAGIGCLLAVGKAASVRNLTELQGLATRFDTDASIARLRGSALVQDAGKPNGHIKLALSPAGLRLVGLLEREERDARRRAQSVTVSRKKRAYVKSGKFVGKAAKQRAKKDGASA